MPDALYPVNTEWRGPEQSIVPRIVPALATQRNGVTLLPGGDRIIQHHGAKTIGKFILTYYTHSNQSPPMSYFVGIASWRRTNGQVASARLSGVFG